MVFFDYFATITVGNRNWQDKVRPIFGKQMLLFYFFPAWAIIIPLNARLNHFLGNYVKCVISDSENIYIIFTTIVMKLLVIKVKQWDIALCHVRRLPFINALHMHTLVNGAAAHQFFKDLYIFYKTITITKNTFNMWFLSDMIVFL